MYVLARYRDVRRKEGIASPVASAQAACTPDRRPVQTEPDKPGQKTGWCTSTLNRPTDGLRSRTVRHTHRGGGVSSLASFIGWEKNGLPGLHASPCHGQSHSAALGDPESQVI